MKYFLALVLFVSVASGQDSLSFGKLIPIGRYSDLYILPTYTDVCIGIFVNHYAEYEKECYNDSTMVIQYNYHRGCEEKTWIDSNGVKWRDDTYETSNLYVSPAIYVEPSIDTVATHRPPTFDGYMEYLKKLMR